MTDTAATRPYGVLGRVLGHSYTPTIYKELAGLEYVRFEREPEDLAAFMTGDEWEGTNVTIPYKRAVMEYLDELSPLAERMGNVNTITRLPDGRLHGDNTDYFGFQCLVEELGVEVAGKKALVLGATGGAGTTASMVLGDMGAIVVPVGRTSEVNYDNIAQQSDASLLVNCTPAGMFPHCPDAPCTLEGLDALEGVIDIVYNPARTGLMLEAERRGIPCIGGLLMLVAQAAQAVERYTGKATPRERILDVTERLSRREQNIALIGMPGSGKTRVGEQIAQLTGREHIDLDRALEERLGMPCADFIVERGEAAFREQETAELADISKRSGLVLSTGGGVVTRDENYPLLYQNSQIVMLNRKLDELAHKGRPITLRLKIDHNLLVKPGTKLADVREVYSHGQAIAQCAGFIENHGLRATKYPNTAMSAEMVANSERTDVAAIASRSCATLYGLEVLEPNIQDSDNNYTRFVVISREPRVYPGANRTSLMITTANEPGALYRVLERFYALNINLIKLESRPIPGRDFEFMFYFDLDCPFGSKALDDLLDSIDDVCESFTYFGSYTEVL